MLGITLFNPVDNSVPGTGIDLSNFGLSRQFANSPSGRLSFNIVRIVERLTGSASPIVPASRLLIQADDLGGKSVSFSQTPPTFSGGCYPRFVQPGLLDLAARFPAATMGWQSNLSGASQGDAGGALCWEDGDGSIPQNAQPCGHSQPSAISCELATSFDPFFMLMQLGVSSPGAWPTPPPFSTGWPTAWYAEISPFNVASDPSGVWNASFYY